ncbi:DNA/RNA non-specific endonuclease [Weissella diestrammenae]|uniref:DNA/RNA non-specific endonuclease n=1 Tax=Weissella diestrammenae TaxID=1162633 RepID=A0A7G9T6A4_9LACO|nr:DNA/RNA non-specific endonuclease [Weissella diestrammenae]MCM0583325.1 DNA/RNA non-specific endonuclease [Weissella diestrammenae]QNN75629.1 DNA/RNA non-specific endonuclease [Weissella diestrammenae]
MRKQRRRQTQTTIWGTVLVVVVAILLKTVDGEFNFSNKNRSTTNYATNQSIRVNQDIDYGSTSDLKPGEQLASSVLSDEVKKQLKAKQIQFNGSGAFIINQNQTTLKTAVNSAPYVQLSAIDSLQRPKVANAWLNQTTRQYQNRQATGNNRTIQPVGWQQIKLGGRYQVLYNRGHLIGYAIAGNAKGFDASEANVKNIATQTAWANQASNGDNQNTGQNYYEILVRRALDQHKKIRYRVTPIYEQDNLVPSGNQIEAKSSDGTLVFNVFVPNVQPGVAINYLTGEGKVVSVK